MLACVIGQVILLPCSPKGASTAKANGLATGNTVNFAENSYKLTRHSCTTSTEKGDTIRKEEAPHLSSSTRLRTWSKELLLSMAPLRCAMTSSVPSMMSSSPRSCMLPRGTNGVDPAELSLWRSGPPWCPSRATTGVELELDAEAWVAMLLLGPRVGGSTGAGRANWNVWLLEEEDEGGRGRGAVLPALVLVVFVVVLVPNTLRKVNCLV